MDREKLSLRQLADRKKRKLRTSTVRNTALISFVVPLYEAVLEADLPVEPESNWEFVLTRPTTYLLGEQDRTWGHPKAPVLELVYTGSAESEEEARLDLADIMSALRVIFQDGQPDSSKVWSEHSKVRTAYYGLGSFRGYRVGVELTCPWEPRDCEIVKRVNTQTVYAVSCARDEAA